MSRIMIFACVLSTFLIGFLVGADELTLEKLSAIAVAFIALHFISEWLEKRRP